VSQSYPRVFVRVVATSAVLLAVGGAIALASPAYAAVPAADLSVTAQTSKIAVDSTGKPFKVEIHNDGPDPASAVSLMFDLSSLDTSKLDVSLPALCERNGAVVTCDFSDVGDLRASGNIDFALGLVRVGGTGAAGSITVVVKSDAIDPDDTDNQATAAIEIVGHGADIATFGQDVQYFRQLPPPNGVVDWVMTNFGDEVADGLKFTVALPRRVSFLRHDAFCTYSADNRVAQCSLPDVVLPPRHSFAPDSDAGIPILVDIDDPGPVALPGGIVTGDAIRSVPIDEAAALDVSKAPAGYSISASSVSRASLDVDAGDNSFRFTIFVDAAAGNGGLPTTGSRPGLLGGIGLAAVVVGVVLFVMGRRRRQLAPEGWRAGGR
jgi:hypothetical protein